MDPLERARRQQEGRVLLAFAVTLALEQSKAGRVFVFEHPAGASSWSEGPLTRLAQVPGVSAVDFDT
eukprot:4277332-Pyramimonas_sp.AAC.1